MKKQDKKRKQEFSKVLLVQESILIWILTISFIILAFICVMKGYLGSLPWLTSVSAFPWSAYGVSQAFYYNKAKAENSTESGIAYHTLMKNITSDDEDESGIDYQV